MPDTNPVVHDYSGTAAPTNGATESAQPMSFADWAKLYPSKLQGADFSSTYAVQQQDLRSRYQKYLQGLQQSGATPTAGGGSVGGAGATSWDGTPGNRSADYNLPGAQQRDAYLQQLLQRAERQQAPQLGQAAQIAASPYAAQQQSLANYLQATASGQGPSLAQQQYRQASDQGQQQQLAFAASGSPSDAAMNARLASQNMGRIQQGMSAGLAQAGTQERMGAQQALGNLLTGARGQDLAQGQFNAGAQNQFGMANAGYQLQQQGITNAALANYLGLGLQNAQAQLNGRMGYEGNDLNRYQTDQGRPTGWQTAAGAAGSILPFFF